MTPSSYPVMPGHRNIDTSVDAAQAITMAAGHLQRLALRTIRAAGARGLTTNELAETVRVHRDSMQPRTSELRDRGLIRDSGARRLNANGKRAIVWVALAEASRADLPELAGTVVHHG